MFCINCGKEINDGSSFCPHCGKSQSIKEPVQEKASDSAPKTTLSQETAKEKSTYNTACILAPIIGFVAMIFAPGGLTGLITIGISAFGAIDATKKKEKGIIPAAIGFFLGLCATAIW